MSSEVLFQLTSWKRNDLIDRHRFYVEQVQKRVLSQLTDEAITNEADSVADETWEGGGRFFNPDYDDGSELAENAFNDGLARWELLYDLRKNLLLSSTTALFHNWEKKLREWLTEEITRWYRGDSLKIAVWRASFDEILNLLKDIGVDVRTKGYFADLDACRLIVNVYKHGRGNSFDELRAKYPTYLRSFGVSSEDGIVFQMLDDWRDHTSLEVDAEDLSRFSCAILEFWKSVPDEFMEGDLERLPKWFRDAI